MLHYYRVLYSSKKCGVQMPDFLASRQTQIESLVLLPPCLLGKESKMMLWNASCLKPLVIPQAQDDLEAIYVAYFAQDQFVQEKELCFVHWRLARWISESFFYWTKRIGCKTSFLRYHGDSGKSLEDLRFWKSMNEFSISICADFTFLCVCWIPSVVSDSL